MTTATANKWTFDAPDWDKRLLRGATPVNLKPVSKHLNRRRVDAAMEFLHLVRLHDVPGQPFLLDSCPQWFIEVVQAAAGGLHAKGKQRLSEIFVCLAKKNSKTSYGGILMLTLMAISPRPRADYLLLAPRVDTAQLSFQAITGAIYAHDDLRERFEVREHIKSIRDLQSGCNLRIKNFELSSVTGSKPAAYLVDEEWLLPPLEASRVFAQLSGGQASIPEAQAIHLSTHADKAPSGYWKSILDRARNVRDTGSEDGFLPFIFEPPEYLLKDVDQLDRDPERLQKILRCSNPSLGYSVREDWLIEEFRKKHQAGGQELAIYLSQHCNAESTFTGTGDHGWIGARYWAHGGMDFDAGLDMILEEADKLVVGLDAGGLSDMSAVCVLGRLPGDQWVAWVHCWLCQAGLEVQRSVTAELELFAEQGDLSIIEPGEDVPAATAIVQRVWEYSEKLSGIGIDPANTAADFQAAFIEAGVDEERIFAVPQGYKLLASYQGLERRLADGRLKHCRQQVLGWCVGNAQQNPKGLVTKASSPRKIDALVALATAGQVMSTTDDPNVFSVEAWIA